MNNDQHITLHQVLHGYSDGHRLLRSSLELSKEAQRTMLVQSDMSGPSMTEGFTEYLSGYYLPSDKYYVFAKTWFAPEMDRPGCVWTHSLLIGYKQLQKINNINLLTNQFIRPKQDLYHSYDQQLFVSPNDTTQLKIIKKEFHTEILNKFILMLFKNQREITPCVLAANASTEYEKEILGIWSMLWPKAKSSFSFSSGSLAPRIIHNKPFVLQISPRKISNQFSRYHTNIKILEDRPTTGSYPDWVRSASNHLISITDKRQHKPYWAYANIFSASIFDFKQLIEISLYKESLADKNLSIDDLIEVLYKRYPSPNEGTLIKLALFSPDYVEYISDKDIKIKFSIVRSIVTTLRFEMFPSKQIGMINWAKIIWQSTDRKTRSDLLNELVDMDLNKLGLELLKELASMINTSDLIDLSRYNQELIFTFVSLNPAIAAEKIFWSNPKYDQVELLSIFAKSQFITEENKIAVINSILESGANWLLNPLCDYFGDLTSVAILQWLNGKNNFIPNDNKALQNIVSKFPDKCLEFLSFQEHTRPHLIALIANILNPKSNIVKKYGPALWLKAIESIKNYNFESESSENLIIVEISQFLLSYAFINPDSDSDKLAAFSFPIIHNELLLGTLDYKFWRRIAPALPHVSWYASWDKCEQLRLGLVDQFIKNKWSLSEFLECTKEPKLFRLVLRSALSKYKNKKFIRTLSVKIQNGEVEAKNFQIEDLQKFTKNFD